MEPTSHFLDIDGVKIHVADWGGSGPDLLLIHANGFLGRLYRLMLARWVTHYHVRTMDWRGQGDSEKPPLEQCQWSNLHRDVEQVADRLGLSGFYGVGHSGGGAMLAYYAATHPQRVKSLALMEPVVIPHEPPFLEQMQTENSPLVERTLRRRIVWDSREQLFAAYQGKDAFAQWREEVLWDYANYGVYDLPDGRAALKCSAEVEAQIFTTTRSQDMFSHIHKIDCPVLVLRGEYTEPFLALAAERIAQRIPQGSLTTVPRTSHFLAMEKPEEVAEIIRQYFAAIK
ncbi:MAG: alpha/beta fold hydrolase [Candidatus Binatia bacterium]